MNFVFLAALVLYLAAFIVMGLMDLRRVKGFKDYSVAGKRQGSLAVLMTLLATMIGASTTIGITDTVYRIGFPGIWWLAFGALGLVLQACFLSEKVRSLDADTLPHLAEKTVGKSAGLLIALVIAVSWVGVIAGQLVAMNSLISFALGKDSPAVFVVVSLIVIAYTMAGGQLSVVRTDRLQLLIVLFGMLSCAAYLYLGKGVGGRNLWSNVELLNASYGPTDLFTQFFVIGGVYFLGPDILSRNFIARDGAAAKKAALVAGLVMLLFALTVTLIGMWLRLSVAPALLEGRSALLYAVSLLPKPLAVLLLFALLSAILSSTDTCLINASSIFARDILGRESVAAVRLTVLAVGILALALALLGRGDILGLLTGAYSIYTPGVIFPLALAIWAFGKHGIRRGVWLAAVAAGGACGLAGAYAAPVLRSLGIPALVMQNLTLLGMGLSLLLSLLSVRFRKCSDLP